MRGAKRRKEEKVEVNEIINNMLLPYGEGTLPCVLCYVRRIRLEISSYKHSWH